MKLTITMEFNAERDRDGETEADEQRAMDLALDDARSYYEGLVRRARAEGIELDISTTAS